MAQNGSIKLAESSETGQVKLNPEAISVLAGLPPPLKVISIFGPSQSGKSYLLNLLAGSQGFVVSNDDMQKSPCMYMWCLSDPQCSDQTLVLLDSEGFEQDVVTQGRDCSPLFTLSMLLSSVFIYNTWGPLTRDTLDQLLHITLLNNLVNLPSAVQASEKFLPEFVWCLRDVDLEKNLGNIELQPADFLDSVLNDIQDHFSPAGVILNMFPRSKINLFDFGHPQPGVCDLGNLTLSELSFSFSAQIKDLRKFLYKSKPKAFLDGHSMTGKELATLAEQFVESISRGSVLDLSVVNEKSSASAVPDQAFHIPDQDLHMPDQDFHIPDQQLNVPCQKFSKKLTKSSPETVNTVNQVSHDPVEMQEPICLIENTEENELKINQEAIRILSSIFKPVVVVSIVGLYRTGKSYLMNRLSGKRTGFSLGSTIQSNTKGIWMWCVPLPHREDITLVLLDTEGLGDVEKGDPKNDHWIFALSVLLSSTFVYNSVGTINNDAVMNLHYVTELTKHIKVKSSHVDEAEISSEYLRFFPSFVWAVRDFTLALERNGQPITADEYLENSLKLKKGFSPTVMSSNSARECIRNYFPSRKCFVFNMPVQPAKLKIIEQLNDSDLDPEFVRQATDFCNYVFRHSQEKTIKGGIKVTGSLLANLAVTYVDAIRSGQVPCLENAVEALAHIENSAAVEQAHSLYQHTMRERLRLHTDTQEELSEVHEACLREALQLFMERCFKDDEQQYQRNLMDLIKIEYDNKCHENEKLSKGYCDALLLQLEDNMEPQKKYMRPGGYEVFRGDVDNIITEYKRTQGKGIKAELALEEFLTKINELGKSIMTVDKSLSNQQKRVEEERARAEASRCRVEAERRDRRALERRLLDNQRAHEENRRQLVEKMERQDKATREEHQRVMQQKLQEQNALITEGFQDKVNKMQREIDYLKNHNSSGRSRGGSWCVIS